MKTVLIAALLAMCGGGSDDVVKSPQEYVCASGGVHNWMCDPYDCSPYFDQIIDLRCYDATMIPASKVAYYHQPTNEEIWFCADLLEIRYSYLSMGMKLAICGLD